MGISFVGISKRRCWLDYAYGRRALGPSATRASAGSGANLSATIKAVAPHRRLEQLGGIAADEGWLGSRRTCIGPRLAHSS
jgi:hypothetical protein